MSLFPRDLTEYLALRGIPRGNNAKVFLVDSVHGNASNPGTKPNAALTTLDAAVDLCTANHGDIIVLAPGHTETIASAGAVTLDKAGVYVVGIGEKNDRPKFSYSTADTASFLISAANVTIDNLVFDMTGFDGINTPISITAAGCTIRNCEMEFADGTGQADYAIVCSSAASDLTIENNYMFGSGDAGTVAAIHIVGGDSVVIRNNRIVGAFTDTTGGILSDTGATTNLFVEGNDIDNRTAASTKAMIVNAGTTGTVRNNHFSILSGSAPITAAAMMWGGGNSYVAAVNTEASELVSGEGGDAIVTYLLDHLLYVTDGAQNYPAQAVDGSVISKLISKDAAGDTSDFDCRTDSLEALSDKFGGFSGDGGANQDDSVKASLDLAHTDLDAIIVDTENLEHLTGVTTVAADMTAEVVDGSIISRILSKTSDTSSYVPSTDALEMLSDKLGAFSGDGGAAQDDSAKASLDLMHTLHTVTAATGTADIDISEADYTNLQTLVTIAPAVGSPLDDCVVILDCNKAVTGFVAQHAAQTISFVIQRKVDGTNWRGESATTAVAANAMGDETAKRLDIGPVGVTEQVRVGVKLSAENAVDVEFPYVVYYKALAAPTVTPVAAA